MKVQVAGGKILTSTEFFPELQWTSHGYDFVGMFRILPLNSYDGIIGHDWLAKHSPMLTHWSQHWLAFEREGQLVVLHGEEAPQITHDMIELHVVQVAEQEPEQQHNSEIQSLLDHFSEVFATPTGLPPTRQYDHQIPLIPGARPVSMRPYRVAPELKTEIENRIEELLAQDVITQ